MLSVCKERLCRLRHIVYFHLQVKFNVTLFLLWYRLEISVTVDCSRINLGHLVVRSMNVFVYLAPKYKNPVENIIVQCAWHERCYFGNVSLDVSSFTENTILHF